MRMRSLLASATDIRWSEEMTHRAKEWSDWDRHHIERLFIDNLCITSMSVHMQAHIVLDHKHRPGIVLLWSEILIAVSTLILSPFWRCFTKPLRGWGSWTLLLSPSEWWIILGCSRFLDKISWMIDFLIRFSWFSFDRLMDFESDCRDRPNIIPLLEMFYKTP